MCNDSTSARRNERLLVGVTCWCPAKSDARAERAATCLQKLVAQTAPNDTRRGWDVIIIDNDVEHPRLRAAIEEAERERHVRVERLSPQRGWAGGRNTQLDFFIRGSWSHLAMCDQDLYVPDPLWLNDAETAAVSDRLHGFMLVSDHADLRGVITLSTGRHAWISREFLGGIHVVSRHAVETLGGYNTTDFPQPWGFHDCEYGLRLRAAGLLDNCEGRYVDPVMRMVVHEDATSEDADHSVMKAQVVAQYYPVFLRRVVEIQLGQGLFQPLTRSRYRDEAVIGGGA